MGIGLSISRSVVESHDGRLWAAPNDGPGATFFFWLPGEHRRTAARPESEAIMPRATAPATGVGGGG